MCCAAGGEKMTVLEDLYYGNIAPNERSVKRSGVYEKLLKYIVQHECDLNATLTEQQKEIFGKFKDCESELSGMNELEAFISGFKLAARIMIEVTEEATDTES